MTIQEYIKIAANGYPVDEYKYYFPYFINMTCEHCIYNGFACKHPAEEGVCIDYRVERSHKEFEKPNAKYEKKVRG